MSERDRLMTAPMANETHCRIFHGVDCRVPRCNGNTATQRKTVMTQAEINLLTELRVRCDQLMDELASLKQQLAATTAARDDLADIASRLWAGNPNDDTDPECVVCGWDAAQRGHAQSGCTSDVRTRITALRSAGKDSAK